MSALSCNYSFFFSAAWNVSWGILAHSRSREFFKASALSWAVAQAFLSEMDHTQKSRGIKYSDERGHNSFFQNEGKWRSHQSCVLFAVWEGGRTFLLKGEWGILEVVHHLGMSSSQNFVDVRVALISATFNENERGFRTLTDGSPNHRRRRLLATENRFHGCGDTIRTLCQILSFCELNLASTVNIFLSEKVISPACLPSFFAFRESSIFSTSFASATPLAIFLMFRLGVPPYSLPNYFNFGLCASSSRASASGSVPDCRFCCF